MSYLYRSSMMHTLCWFFASLE